jgi:hypothetical protein
MPVRGIGRHWISSGAFVLCASLSWGVASASMAGETVFGSLQSPLGSSNLFDPASGGVPTEGYGNSSSATVLVSNDQEEFAWFQGGGSVLAPGLDSWVADFTNDVLTLTFRDNYGSAYLPSYFLFQSTYFAGRQVSLVGQDSFAPYAGQPSTAVIEGDVLRLVIGEPFIDLPDGVYVNTYSITPVPLPAAAWLLLSGIAAVTAVGKRSAESREPRLSIPLMPA